MPYKITKLPSLRLHKATKQAIVTLSGRDVYLGPHGTRLARENYDRVVAEWLATGRGASQIAPTDAPISVIELVNAFRKSDAIPASHQHSYKSVMKIVVRLYGRTDVASFGPRALQVVRNQMVEAGWNRSTINNRVHMIERVFSWGVANEIVDSSIPAALAKVHGWTAWQRRAPESKEIEAVAVEHVEASLTKMSPTVAAMVKLQMLTGMRAAELCQIRTRDIDTSGKVWVYRPATHKTKHRGKKLEVAIGARGIEILKEWIRPDIDAYIFSPSRAERDRRAQLTAARKTPLSCGNRLGTNRKSKPAREPGNRYTTPSYRRAIYRACDAAFPLPPQLARRPMETKKKWRERLTAVQYIEVVKWRAEHRWNPHQARHAFAVMVRDKFGLEHTQKALGHSNSKVTERYQDCASNLFRFTFSHA